MANVYTRASVNTLCIKQCIGKFEFCVKCIKITKSMTFILHFLTLMSFFVDVIFKIILERIRFYRANRSFKYYTYCITLEDVVSRIRQQSSVSNINAVGTKLYVTEPGKARIQLQRVANTPRSVCRTLTKLLPSTPCLHCLPSYNVTVSVTQ